MPQKKGRVAEILMYAFVGVLVVIAAIGAYVHFSPAWKDVPNRVSQGFEDDRINLLLIGVGGDTHPGEGKDLADSIILASLKPSTRQVALVSLPRDLYVEMSDGMHRLNAAHREGPAYLMKVVESAVGEPVHAYARIDFRAFEGVIDALGGVDIYVYRPFHDYLFNDGFEQGWQHMNGKRALRYARYRYVRASAEGNNFARELRQQQVLEAIKDKIQALPPSGVLKLVNVARTVGNHTDTNLTAPQIAELYSMFRKTSRNDIRNVSLKKYMEVFMVRTPGDTGEAVRPFGNDYSKLHRVIDDVFNGKDPIIMRDEIPLNAVKGP